MDAIVPAAPLRVLVVDDDADTCETTALLIRLLGHEACVARDGRSALALACNYRPHVILLDVMMPRLNGWALARLLREDADLRGAYLVSVTGLGRECDRCQSLEAGCDDHWTKPFEIEQLQLLLETLPSMRRDQRLPR